MRSHSYFSTLEGSQKQTRLPINRFSDEMLLLTFQLDRTLNSHNWNLQKRCCCLDQFVMVDGTVTILSKFLEDMTHAGMRADDRIPWNPESLRQAIRRLEANAVNIEGQAIRILLDAGNGFVAIDFVNADSPCGPDAVGVQEDHNFPDDFLGLPRFDDSLFAFGANPVKFGQAFGGLLNDVKDLLLKGLDQFFGEVWANAFDHPRAQIFFDAFQSTGWDDAEGLCLELEAVGPIIYPDALPFNVLARGDRRCRADSGDQVAVTPDLDSEDTEASLFTMERHTLDRAGQLFCRTG